MGDEVKMKIKELRPQPKGLEKEPQDKPKRQERELMKLKKAKMKSNDNKKLVCLEETLVNKLLPRLPG